MNFVAAEMPSEIRFEHDSQTTVQKIFMFQIDATVPSPDQIFRRVRFKVVRHSSNADYVAEK